MKTCSRIEPLEPRIAPATLTVTNLHDAGTGSLRAAVDSAGDGDQIVFKSSLQGFVHLRSEILVDHAVTIKGGGKITLDGDDSTRLLNVDDDNQFNGKSVQLSGLIFRHGATSEDGGAIFNREALSITNCVFTGNAADNGGAISTYDIIFSSLSVAGSTFSNNTATDSGGAIYTNEANGVTIQNSYFAGNHASTGGALCYYGSGPSPIGPENTALTVSGTQFYKNQASNGGAAYVDSVDHGSVNIAHSSFAKNTATQAAGALVLIGYENCTAVVSKTVFESNTSQGSGGALQISFSGSAQLSGCSILNNLAKGVGAGIFIDSRDGGYSANQTLVLQNTSLSGNHAGTYGGGIYLGVGNLTLDHATVRDNFATLKGGGIAREISADAGQISVIASLIKGNHPDQIASVTPT